MDVLFVSDRLEIAISNVCFHPCRRNKHLRQIGIFPKDEAITVTEGRDLSEEDTRNASSNSNESDQLSKQWPAGCLSGRQLTCTAYPSLFFIVTVNWESQF